MVKDQDILVNALLAGTPADRIKDRMVQLETRQKQLEKELAKIPPSDATLRIHPKMADTYHTRVKSLIARLTQPDNTMEAREEIRSLIEKIVITPVPTGGKRMEPRLHLHGALAGILRLSLGESGKPGQQKTSCEQEVEESAVFMAAGERNRRNLPLLRYSIRKNESRIAKKSYEFKLFDTCFSCG